MADTKISSDPAATSLGAADLFPIVQGGANKTATRGLIVPAGGTAGQVLKKSTGNDFDYGWGTDNVGTGTAPQNNFTATSDPLATSDSGGGYSAGSHWFNATTGVVFFCTDATAGAAVWRTIGVKGHVQYQSGTWYLGAKYGAASIVGTVQTGFEYSIPWTIEEKVTIQAIGAETSTQVTGNIRFSLRASAGGRPGALLTQTGIIALPGTAAQDVVGTLPSAITLKPGIYWPSVMADCAASLRMIGSTDMAAGEQVGSPSGTGLAALVKGSGQTNGLRATATFANGFADPGTGFSQYGQGQPILAFLTQ